MFRILLVGLISFISFFSSIAQPDVSQWDDKVQMSILESIQLKQMVVSSGCDWIPPFLDDWADVDEFRDYIDGFDDIDFSNKLKGWKIILPDENLRVIPENVDKVDEFIQIFNPITSKINSQFNNYITNFRQNWINHLIYRTKISNGVNIAGNKADKFNSFKPSDYSTVPGQYTDDIDRFNDLASDPDHGGQIKTLGMREASAGMELEFQGLINDIVRGPKGLEFYDANSIPWDVKCPTGNYFSVTGGGGIGDAIKKELTISKTIDGVVHPPGQFINPNTGIPEFKRIILDVTYINQTQLSDLRNWLLNDSGLTLEQLERIIEVNVNIF